MSRSEVSVVIPTCCRPTFLRNAIGSVEMAAAVAELTTDGVEIIVVDDGHCDQSRAVCEELRAKSKYSLSYLRTNAGPREGPGAARNQGVDATTGHFIYLIDDDDQFLENRFKNSLPLLRSGEVDAVFEPSLRQFTDGSGRASYIHGPDGRVFANAAEVVEYLLSVDKSGHLSQAAVACTKNIFHTIGGVDPSLRYAQDGEFLLRLAALGRVALLSGEPVATDYIHGANHSRPDKLSYHTSISMLRVLYGNLSRRNAAPQRAVVRRALRGKFDLALVRCRRETQSYSERLQSGVLVLWHYPWTCLTWKNVKSAAVWLCKF